MVGVELKVLVRDRSELSRAELSSQTLAVSELKHAALTWR